MENTYHLKSSLLLLVIHIECKRIWAELFLYYFCNIAVMMRRQLKVCKQLDWDFFYEMKKGFLS